jgi:hypothetical protein
LHFQARKIAITGTRSTVLLITKQMSYHYTTNSLGNLVIFLFICHDENYDL